MILCKIYTRYSVVDYDYTTIKIPDKSPLSSQNQDLSTGENQSERSVILWQKKTTYKKPFRGQET